MSIRTKIDFSGITSDNIVTSDNKKYIREDDEIFNSLKDEIAACENAQVQTEIATLQILDIKEQTKVIANDAIDTATDRAETAAENAENAQALAETAAINALEAERNVTEFSETLAKLDEDNTFTGTNNFTGTLTVNDEEVLTSSDFDDFVKLDEDNTFSGTNNFTGTLQSKGNTVLTTSDAASFAKLNEDNNFTGSLSINGDEVLTTTATETFAKLDGDNAFTGNLTVGGEDILTASDANAFAKLSSNNTFSGTNNFTGSLTKNGNAVLTASDTSSFAKTNTNNTFSGTNNFTGTLQSKGNTVLTTSDASNYFKLNTTNTIGSNILFKDTTASINCGYEYNSRKGAVMSFNSINHTTESYRGAFNIFARDATNSYALQGRAYDGALLWKGKHVITQDTPYNIFFDQTNGTNKYLGYNQDSNKTVSGSYIKFFNAKDSASGQLLLSARNLEKSANLTLAPDGTLTWSGNNITVNGKSVVTRIAADQLTALWNNHLSSGLLIQSGAYVFDSGDTTSDVITLTRPYSNPYYAVLVILDGDSQNSGSGMLSVVSKTKTNFKIHNGEDKAGAYRWIAIGNSNDFS